MVRTNQGGSILSFIIIGVVLLGLLLGGAYFVRQRTSAPGRVATSQTSKPAPSNDKGASSNDSSKNNAPATTPEASKPSTTPSTGGSNNQSTSNNTTPAPSALPRTGPAETLGSVVGLALLTVSGLAYHRSRRLPATL